MPDLISVVPTVADHIPAVRHQLVRRLGPEGTDLLFSVANSLTAALTVSPTSAAAEAVARSMLTVEAWIARLAWHRHEEVLAENCPDGGAPAPGTAIFTAGPGEEFANRFGWIGLTAAVVIGALSRNPASRFPNAKEFAAALAPFEADRRLATREIAALDVAGGERLHEARERPRAELLAGALQHP